jgi:3-methylfumaryl-CoA hydratase
MDDFSNSIGRTREQQDEITRPALVRIAALLDRDADFPTGSPIPPHWYAMFFPDIVPQSQIGEDGHPRRGDFLPPVALPRRMFAGRRMQFLAPLRVGDTAIKKSEIAAITPKRGRSGQMVFVTIRHTISVAGAAVLTDEQDVVYREVATPGARPPEPTPPPADPAWSERVTPTTPLLFRYSAITFNAHRIHYDADYVRGAEGYPGLVVNGGLTLLLLLEAAIRNLGRTPRGVAVRNIRPLYCDNPITLAGRDAAAWAADSTGALAVSAELAL